MPSVTAAVATRITLRTSPIALVIKERTVWSSFENSLPLSSNFISCLTSFQPINSIRNAMTSLITSSVACCSRYVFICSNVSIIKTPFAEKNFLCFFEAVFCSAFRIFILPHKFKKCNIVKKFPFGY